MKARWVAGPVALAAIALSIDAAIPRPSCDLNCAEKRLNYVLSDVVGDKGLSPSDARITGVQEGNEEFSFDVTIREERFIFMIGKEGGWINQSSLQ